MQLSLFDNVVENKVIKDIRTDKQIRNEYSYDVGEKIGNARKDLVFHHKTFLKTPSVEILQSIEKEDVTLAAQIVVRDTFFSWFSLEDCKERGVAPQVAKAFQLLIQSIVKSPEDTKDAREQYSKACIFVSNLLKNIKSFEEFREFEHKIVRLLRHELYSLEYQQNSLKSTIESIQYETDKEIITKLKEKVERQNLTIQYIEEANEIGLSMLGKSFRNFFLNKASRKSAYKSILSVESWDDLLKRPSARRKKTERKPVWEREMPERPDRQGGQIIHIEKPEEFASLFGFKGVEFGHWVEDKTARAHLFRAAEAFTDLADILNVPITALSLNQELSIGFGSRGKGRAWGHFEPSRRVINLTKTKGSLGILSHEWFHALDNHLYRLSYNFENGKIGFVSEGNIGPHLPNEIRDAILNFVQSLKEGESTAYIDVSQRKSRYRVYTSFKERYNLVDGNLQEFMDETMRAFDERVESMLRMYNSSAQAYYNSAKEKYERKRKRELRTNAEALAQYHEEVTGEKVDKIPYTVPHSQYFQNSIEADKNQIGKYWSSNVELAARAFESYITDKLAERGWVSDYLVCGAYGNIYPNDQERETINESVASLVNELNKILV